MSDMLTQNYNEPVCLNIPCDFSNAPILRVLEVFK